MKINMDDVKKNYGGKAKEYMHDRKKAKGLVDQVMEKGSKENEKDGAITGVWGKIKLFVRLIRDWLSGEYTTIPYRSLLAIFIALVYFVSPIDIIPDFILGLGMVDDAAVILQVFKAINKDIEKYQLWLDTKIIDINIEE